MAVHFLHLIAFLPTDDIKIFESVLEMRQFLFDNIKGIISDAYKDFQQEKRVNKLLESTRMSPGLYRLIQ